MIITIDGPGGSGKSTAACGLAVRLGVPCLDTGAMYRAVGLRALRLGTNLSDDEALLFVASAADIQLDCNPEHPRVMLDGEDVTKATRTLEVSEATRFVARNQAVRKLLIERQRCLGEKLGAFVTDGRDQGSVVFPAADVKFVLTADIEKRARRHYTAIVKHRPDVTLDEVRANLCARDENDAVQWVSLRQGGLAICIDSTDMTSDEVVDRMHGEVCRERETRLARARSRNLAP